MLLLDFQDTGTAAGLGGQDLTVYQDTPGCQPAAAPASRLLFEFGRDRRGPPRLQRRHMVAIDACDTGVENVRFPSGCSLVDLVGRCGEPGPSRAGACLPQLANPLERWGMLTSEQAAGLRAGARIPPGRPAAWRGRAGRRLRPAGPSPAR